MACSNCGAESCEHIEAAEKERAEKERAESERKAAEEAQKNEAARTGKDKDKEKPRDIVGDALDELRRAAKKPQESAFPPNAKFKIHVDNSRTEYHYSGGGQQSSFSDLLDVLTGRWDDPGESDFDADELREQSEALRIGRLILVSCDDMSR